ncbi:hypothetical protein BDP55DRAFT_241685 [Colletotrichum godetiae]|uniref:Uncharacterized protein n=1 Tax=Colletotrichum godetiae TaxID=1209918 RepID=A0AAJ0AG50_9PEZI|nr:uncharacterized protein BDP55DRAFT_241685 [Colletotrichum godetiae]KAK1672614.1 hypothetical protein BDP55DRAFT_241685 [Colletotrichum godetiae]
MRHRSHCGTQHTYGTCGETASVKLRSRTARVRRWCVGSRMPLPSSPSALIDGTTCLPGHRGHGQDGRQAADCSCCGEFPASRHVPTPASPLYSHQTTSHPLPYDMPSSSHSIPTAWPASSVSHAPIPVTKPTTTITRARLEKS